MKTVNQYVIYGILVQINTQERWDLGGTEDISILFNTRDGESVIIGKILKHNTIDSTTSYSELLDIDDLKMNDADEIIIQDSVGRKFGVAGDFHYYVWQIRR